MALSLSRPDPTSPASVAEASFPTSRRGFQQDDVRSVLRDVAAELGRLQERERFLERELRAAQATAPSGELDFDEETVTQLLGEETLRVLQTARESASQIKIRAEESAARIVREATETVSRLRHEAELEVARVRAEASADAESELSLAKQQGREMVNEARAYRERVLSELSRRRETARQQIEQLIHGRDRLMQVFERARLVAVDVLSELEPLGEPDEYVDLTSTTGPVPMMVPASELGRTDAGIYDGAEEITGADGPVVSEPDVSELDNAADEQTDTDPADDSADTDPADDGDPDPGDDGEDVEAAETNVVSLFGEPEGGASEPDGGASEPDDGASEPDDHAAPATELRADLNGLFAKLRAETTDDAPSASPSPAGADVTGDTTEPAEPIADADGDAGTTVSGSETIFERRDADLVPLIVSSARRLKRVLADEQNDVLDTLRSAKQVTVLADLLPDIDDHAARYVEAISAELDAASAAGAALMVSDHHSTSAAPASVDFAGVRVFVATHLIGPLRDRLERSVVDGDGATDDIVRRVRSVYREWKTQHIDGQLDDVLRLAHGAGLLASVTAGTPLCWAVDPAGPPCPDAEDNSLAGPVPAGDPYPTGHRNAPAHAGCRCLLSQPAE